MTINGTAKEIELFKDFCLRGRLNIPFTAGIIHHGVETQTKVSFLDKEVQLIVEDAVKKEAKPDVLYICNHRACGRCSNSECNHTKDIKHAKNFENVHGKFWEKELPSDLLCATLESIPEDAGKGIGST